MRGSQTCSLSLLVSVAMAQAVDPAVDPYTRGQPAALARAGIVEFERFAWTDDHTTVDIQRLMGFEPFHFVETAHFKIASSLGPVAVPLDAGARARLKNELVELGAHLSGVDPQTHLLDPWLRLHVYAQRLERAYAEFARRFGVTDAAMARCRPGSAAAADYCGEGPHLGQRGKFLVMLARSGTSLGTYARNFLDLPAPRTTTRHYLTGPGSLLLLTAEQLPDEDLRGDAALNASVAYHAGHMFVDAYRHYWHDCPAWFEEGLAHWFGMRAEPNHASFATRPDEVPRDSMAVDWGANVRARLAHGNSIGADELFRLRNDALRYEHHLAAWSRVDFLLQAHAEAMPLLARMLKGPDPDRVPPKPSEATVMARQAEAFSKVLGWSPTEFDAQWSAWAMHFYPKT